MQYKHNKERMRLTCVSCGYICYENPVVGVAAIVLNDKRQILLGRRKNGKYKGRWCIPCGYVEYDEDVYDGVVRETAEETGLNVEICGVFTVLSNFHEPECHSVGIWFRANVIGGQPRAGDDIDQLGYFSPDSLPPMAFPTDEKVIDMLNQ